MIKEAIILAGGLGTRLRPVVSELPKCMAPVAGKPFLWHVLSYLKKEGIEKFIFSVGYKNEVIRDYIQQELTEQTYFFAVEEEPLGTGGAIKLSAKNATEKNVLLVNGDTLFSVNVAMLSHAHEAADADCTLTLKPMNDFERYGVVELNNDSTILSFKEKQFYKSGLINGGVYALNLPRFIAENLPIKFSFEKDYLENYFDKRKMYGLVQDKYFIDIGIPEDYERAERELKIKN